MILIIALTIQNGGPRLCVGQQFALTEVAYTIVRILQRFDRIEKYWPGDEVLLKSEIVLSPPKGVQIGFWGVGQEAKKHQY
jgi:cytochrome P450